MCLSLARLTLQTWRWTQCIAVKCRQIFTRLHGAAFQEITLFIMNLYMPFLAYSPKVGLYDLHPVCVSVYPPYKLLNAWTNLYEIWNVRLYHDTWAHLSGVLHKSLPSVCVSVCVSLLLLQGSGSVKCIPPYDARKRLGKHVPAATNTRNNRRIVGCVISYAVRVLSKESLWVSLCIPLLLLGNNTVKTFPRQRRIVRSVVFMRSVTIRGK
jgi:hypothetical protein